MELIAIARMMGMGKPQDQRKECDSKGVADGGPEHGAVKILLKIFETRPVSARDTLAEIKILEGQLQAVHRPIAEDIRIYKAAGRIITHSCQSLLRALLRLNFFLGIAAAAVFACFMRILLSIYCILHM